MSERATMLQETVEAYADLHGILDGLTEERVNRIRLGVLGVRDLVIRWPGMLCKCTDQRSEAAERVNKTRMTWAPGSFWGLGYRDDRNGG
jgi:hypothetical protein